MLAVRYVALGALVIWLGGMVAVAFPYVMRRFHFVAVACGGVIVVSLFVMKFVGPPPHGFVPRVALTVLMLVLLAVSAFMPGASADTLYVPGSRNGSVIAATTAIAPVSRASADQSAHNRRRVSSSARYNATTGLKNRR